MINPKVRPSISSFFILIFFICLVYGNSLDTSWHFDDLDNIVNNPQIHINDLYPNSLMKTMYGAYDGGRYVGDQLYRPIPMLSFGLNWFWGGGNVLGFHLVNIAIHILSGLFLYLTCLNLLNTPVIREKYPGAGNDVALLTAVLWAIHPINTMAVTYIVQRMASMAGLFFIAGFYCYLRGRNTEGWKKQSVLILISFMLFVLAYLCKRNTVIFPILLLVAELTFYNDIGKIRLSKKALLSIVLLFFIILSGTIILFWDSSFSSYFSGYKLREFTRLQRMMTEPRVLLTYLKQIFIPVETNFSIESDIAFSTSILSPWTTLPSMIAIIGLILFGIARIRRVPLLSFAILFFFVAHTVESTVIPLELSFEHRNYIPSMFIFLPISFWVDKLLHQYKRLPDKKLIYGLIIMVVPVYIFTTALSTNSRNFVWKDDTSLWKDAMVKAPHSARACQNYAFSLYKRYGISHAEQAIGLYKKALSLRSHKTRDFLDMISYENLRLIYTDLEDYDRAVYYGKKAISSRPDNEFVRINYARMLVRAGKIEDALPVVTSVLEASPEALDPLILKAEIYFKLKKGGLAHDPCLKIVRLNPFHKYAMAYWALYQFHVNHFERADLYFKKALSLAKDKKDLFIYLGLIANSLKRGNDTLADRYISEVVRQFSLSQIEESIANYIDCPFPLLYFTDATLPEKLKTGLLQGFCKRAESKR